LNTAIFSRWAPNIASCFRLHMRSAPIRLYKCGRDTQLKLLTLCCFFLNDVRRNENSLARRLDGIVFRTSQEVFMIVEKKKVLIIKDMTSIEWLERAKKI
jgi:hypothetical protein